eukprot:scaffold1190_cov69-Cylindrotheca_fusiformis.AAC.4
MELPEGLQVTELGLFAAYGCVSLATVNTPASVIEIGIAIIPRGNLDSCFRIADGNPDDTDDEGFFDLVNLAMPRDGEVLASGLLYDNSKLGKVIDDEADLRRKLKHRVLL